MSQTAIQDFRWATNHAYERAWEHFGIEFKKPDWRDVVMDIIETIHGWGTDAARPRAMLLSRNARDDREIWLCQRLGAMIRVVYSPAQAEVITVGPPGYKLVAPHNMAPEPRKQFGRRRQRQTHDDMEGWQ